MPPKQKFNGCIPGERFMHNGNVSSIHQPRRKNNMKATRSFVFALASIVNSLISSALQAAEPEQSAFTEAYASSLREMEAYRKTGFFVGVEQNASTVAAVTRAYNLGKDTVTDPVVLAQLAVNYGAVTRDLTEAGAVLEQAIELIDGYQKQHKDDPALIRLLMDIGHLNYLFKGPAGADKYYKRAFKLADKYWSGDMRLADLYLEAGVKLTAKPYVTGKDYLEDALAIYSTLAGDQAIEGVAVANTHLGRFWIRRGLYLKAEELLNAGISALGDAPPASTTLLGLHTQFVRLYVAMHKPELASRHSQIIGATFAGVTTGELVPLYTVSPGYPRNALRLKIEGYVTLSFTVNEAGEVVNPLVVERSGHHEFEGSAVTAANQLRYAPRFINGSAVATENVRFTFRFGIIE
jgi:TonB family protein